MPIAADRPGAASVLRAVTLRIKRGAKLLSDVKIGRSRVVVGGGKTAQLRLKNAGLADECLVIDTRNEPFGIESRLGPDDVRVNGRPILSSLIRVGDVIELSGLTLELVEGEPGARAASPEPEPEPPPAQRPVLRPTVDRRPAPPPAEASPAPLPEEAIDPYHGKNTAGRLNRSELEPPARAPGLPLPPDPIGATRPSVRPPWIELVGDDSVSEARLYLQDGTTAGRQGDVRVRHPSVSKKHAKFTIERGQLFVEDLGSTNGVWINRERINSRRPIVEGDTLHLGAVEFAVRVPVQAGAEVTNFAAEPEPSIPPARLDRASGASEEGEPAGRPKADQGRNARPSVTAERPPVPGTIPRSRDAREKRTEADGVPPGRFADPWADAGTDRDRGTEREIPAAKRGGGVDRLTEREEGEGQPRVRSPFEEAELEEDGPAPTKTGQPGRRDKTDREPAATAPARRDATERERAAAPRLSAPPPPPQPSPTPSALFGDVEDLSEKYSTKGKVESDLELERRPDRMPVRTTVRPAGSFADAIGDEDFVPRKRRSFGKMVAVAFLGFVFGGLVVGVLAIWPRFALLLQKESSPIADGSRARPDGSAPNALPTVKPNTVKTDAGKKPAGGTPRIASTTKTDTVPVTSPDTSPDVGVEEDGPVSIFDGAPVDLRSDGRLDKELASLEKDGAGNALRVEKQIGSDELKSIFLASESAVVRRLHREDGFELAPSAADEDPRDAEAKRQGAKQIDPNRVNALIREKFPAVKKCLVGASVKRGKARVVVEFTIQPSGKSENVSVIDSDIGGSGFKSCVSGVVRGIKFPKTKDQSVVVQFPFVFTYN